MASRLLPDSGMDKDELRQMLRDVFGESMGRMEQFRDDQLTRLEQKIQEIAHEGVKDELNKLSTEIKNLKRRIGEIEAERAANLSEGT